MAKIEKRGQYNFINTSTPSFPQVFKYHKIRNVISSDFPPLYFREEDESGCL